MSARLLVLFTNNPTYGVSVRPAQEKTALKRASRKHKHKGKNKHKDQNILGQSPSLWHF